MDTSPTFYIESDHPEIVRFAREAAGDAVTAVEQAVRLYYAVRDGFRYNPYRLSLEKDPYRASYVLAAGEGFCIQKAILLAAAGRSLGIPCRLGFANVRNHLATKKLLELMQTDLFVFHGYTTFFLHGAWVKATPAFDLGLCEKFGILPLEFDGMADSIFHPLDRSGQRHMEYVHDYGQFDDLPYDLMLSEFRKYYPHIWAYYEAQGTFSQTGAFRTES